VRTSYTNRNFHSIFSRCPRVILIEIMCGIKHSLRRIAVIVLMLALCSISPTMLAWQGDKLAPWTGTNLNGKKCTGVQVAFGPYDYLQRDKFQSDLEVVEESHFNADVENLIAGQSGSILADISYTLLTWPNHHRALNSALRYRLQHLGNWTEDAGTAPVECFLQRAIKFSPKDPKPYMMYGVLLQRTKQFGKALNAYRAANRLSPNDVITQYNMGLTLVELKKYNEAVQVAQKVYSAGFPLPGLKNKLIAAGHWKAGAGAGETKSTTAKQELAPAQLDAIKKAMQATAEQKKTTPAAAP
jgi:tetratricopeptide (TPR) repeat protein